VTLKRFFWFFGTMLFACTAIAFLHEWRSLWSDFLVGLVLYFIYAMGRWEPKP